MQTASTVLEQRALNTAHNQRTDRQLVWRNKRHPNARGARRPSLAQVSGIGALAVSRFARQRHIEVEPPCLSLRVIVDAMALPSSARDSSAALYLGCPFVVCELTGVVDRDENFLAVVVRVQPNAAAWGDDSSMNKSERRACRKRGCVGGTLKN